MIKKRPLLAAAAAALAVTGAVVAVTVTPASAATPWPTANPAPVCGSTSLAGPATAPDGATTVPAGVNAGPWAANTVYWFAPGTHTLGTDQYAQIQPGDGSTFVGAPGAVLDGQGKNSYAFTQQAKNVTVEHLTITGFQAPRDEGVVNHDSGNGWKIYSNTIEKNAGAGLMAGDDNAIKGNCLKDNGQYGLNAYKDTGVHNLVLDGNEITGNNTGDWETKIDGCGCTGGVKFWAVDKADVTGNWVHGNLSVGLWADTNDNDFLIKGNVVEDNAAEALIYEISYNAQVTGNVFRRNALVSGPKNPGFPTGAVYVSESGGESRVPARTAKIDISDNLFDANYGGVIDWANADRFCNSPANTSSGDCTLVHPKVGDCAAPGIDTDPLYTDCRWWTKNVEVHGNTFNAPTGCDPANCGHQGLLSNWGSYPSWSPYQGDKIQKQIVSAAAANLWHDNAYTGAWRFQRLDQGGDNLLAPAAWQATGQDTGSSFDGSVPSSTPATSSPTTVPSTVPPTSATTAPPTSTTTPVPPEKKTIAANNFELGPDTAWYGASVTGVPGGAHQGSWSLKLTTDGAWGSGVQTGNWPGYAGVTAGARYDASVWYKEAAPTMPVVTWTLTWSGDDGTALRADQVPMPRSAAWKKAAAALTAPAGATHVRWSYTWSAPAAGPALLIDQERVAAH